MSFIKRAIRSSRRAGFDAGSSSTVNLRKPRALRMSMQWLAQHAAAPLVVAMIFVSAQEATGSRPAVADVSAGVFLDVDAYGTSESQRSIGGRRMDVKHVQQFENVEPHHADAADAHACEIDTGATCPTNACDSTLNAVCVEGKCQCQEGFCSVDSRCVKESAAPIAQNAPQHEEQHDELKDAASDHNEGAHGHEAHEEEHHHAALHGGDAHGHGQGHHHPTHEDNALAALLIAFVTVVMVQLYMMNTSDPQVRSYSNKLLNTLMAIYCAVLMEEGTKIVWKRWCGLKGAEWQVTVLGMIPLYLIWHLGSYPLGYAVHSRGYDKWFFALRIGVPHVGAFIAIGIFETLEAKGTTWMQQRFGSAVFSYVGVAFFGPFVIMRSFIYLVEAVMRKIYVSAEEEGEDGQDEAAIARRSSGMRRSVNGPMMGIGDASCLADGLKPQEEEEEEDEEEGDWIAEMLEGHEEACALLAGRLLEKTFMFLVTNGKNRGHVHDDMIVPQGDRHAWLVVCAVCLLWLILMVFLYENVFGQHSIGFFYFFAACARFTCAWVFASVSWWIAYDSTVGWTCVFLWHTIQCSLTSYVFIVIFDRIADWYPKTEEYIEAFIEVFAIVLALGWEKSFTLSAEHVGELVAEEAVESNGMIKKANIIRLGTEYMEFVFCIGLVALMTPGWVWFIVPTAMLPTPHRSRECKEEIVVSRGSSSQPFVPKGHGDRVRFEGDVDYAESVQQDDMVPMGETQAQELAPEPGPPSDAPRDESSLPAASATIAQEDLSPSAAPASVDDGGSAAVGSAASH